MESMLSEYRGMLIILLATVIGVVAMQAVVHGGYISAKNNTTVIKTEATVTEKKEEVNRIYTGTTYITTYSYYLYTEIAGSEEDQRIQVPQSYYNKINEDDTVMVDVTINTENKIVDVDLSE